MTDWQPIETAPKDGKHFLGTKNLGVGYGWMQYICRYCDVNKSFGTLFSIAEGGIWYPLNEKTRHPIGWNYRRNQMTEMIKIEKVKTLISPSIRSFEEKVLIPFYGKEIVTDLQVLNGDLNYSVFVLSDRKSLGGSKILITKEEAENGSYKINFQQKLKEASNEILTKAGFSALP